MSRKTYYQELMEGLKTILKKRKVTYQDVASELKLSVASVKRIFNSSDGNLSKIQVICEWLEISFSDLVQLSNTDEEETYTTNPKQEAFFLKHPGSMQFFVELYEYGQGPEEIANHYNLTKKSLNFYLSSLEKLGLLEVHPFNKIKFKIKGFFAVSEKGKLAKSLVSSTFTNLTKYFEKIIETPPEEEKSNRKAMVSLGELLFTEASALEILQDLNNLQKKMHHLSSREIRLYPKKELIPYQFLLGLIPERIMKDKIPNI